jgi:iron complex transport system substrate-binding protein
MPARLSRRAVLAVALSAVLPLAACSGGSSEGAPAPAASPSASAAAFPVTVEHAFGSTTIESAPARVVTWGWGSTDAAIALGVVPVAMPKQTYGGDAEGVLPWVRERLEADGAPLPTILPDEQTAPAEAIAAARPDLILAPYSGLTQAEYDTLSRIAPVVAYPEQPWATPWRDTIRIVGTSLGKAAEADALLADIDATVTAKAAEHPELAGKSVAVVFPTAQEFYVYKPADPRVGFTNDLGLVNAPSVDALASGDQTFFYTLSTERLDELTSDVLLSYADSQEAQDAFLSSAGAKLMPQVRNGAVASVVGTSLVSSVSPPTALSLTWGIDALTAELSKAAKAADAAQG